MTYIYRIILTNYRQFCKYEIFPNKKVNVLIGDNESGKSSILEAIELTISGNIKKVESLGLSNLINIKAVNDFLAGEKTIEKLPKMIVELYLKGENDFEMNGKNNSSNTLDNGIRLVCEPNEDYREEINDILKEEGDFFPYEFYRIRFSTFSDMNYSSYKKKVKSVLINSSVNNSEYSTNEFVKKMYYKFTGGDSKERIINKSEFKKMKFDFCASKFGSLNTKIPSGKNYEFGFKYNSNNNLEDELMIYENKIGLNNRGTGRQVIIKTDFALEKADADFDVLLIEEPENHLSSVNLRSLIYKLINVTDKQLFITTHNSYACIRMELKNALLLHKENNQSPLKLKDVDEDTSKYFMKMPSSGLLDFILAKKIILVEGPSEFMLIDRFYKKEFNTTYELDGIQVIDVRGLSFKRYLKVAVLLGNKVAIITDNDHDYQLNIKKRYEEFHNCDKIKIFSDSDNDLYTFEIALHHCNKELCDKLFGSDSTNYMLKNKTDSAYKLVNEKCDLTTPEYIKKALKWIRD